MVKFKRAPTVWLNADRLTPFDFWQFWRNVDDRDVGRFLALFTELPMEEIRRLGGLGGAELNEAKVILATEATRLAHGEAVAKNSAGAASGLFSEAETQEGLPTLMIDAARLGTGVTLADLVVEGGLAPSRSAARRLAAGGGLRLNGQPVEQAESLLPCTACEWRLSVGRKHHLRIVVLG